MDKMSKKIYAGTEEAMRLAIGEMDKQGWDAEGGMGFESHEIEGLGKLWLYSQTVVRAINSPFK